jgi:hypothetical protein
MTKGEWNKKWWDASDIDEIKSDEMQLISEFVFIDAKGGWNKKWWDKCLYLNPWSQNIALHFISFALHLFCMCASGNHVLYLIYELYHALEPMVF